MAVVKKLFRYPIKGLSYHEIDEIKVTPLGFEGDRQFAFLFKDSDPGLRDVWVPKTKLLNQNDWPDLVRVKVEYLDDCRVVFSHGNSIEKINLSDPADRDQISKRMSQWMSSFVPSSKAHHSKNTEVVLIGRLDSIESRFPDRVKEHISLINLSSVLDLQHQLGVEIPFQSFRGNILVEGLDPWAEKDWVGKKIQIDDVQLECSSMIARCYNINVHPDSGGHSFDLLSPLKEISRIQLGKNIPTLGILAKVIKQGSIRVGDQINLLL